MSSAHELSRSIVASAPATTRHSLACHELMSMLHPQLILAVEIPAMLSDDASRVLAFQTLTPPLRGTPLPLGEGPGVRADT